MQENNPQGKTTQEGQQENHMAAPALAKGLPQCRDNRDNGEKVDVFILSGAEDLVPIPRSEGGDEPDVLDEQGNGYQIDAFWPRIEGLFARIERWTRVVVSPTAEHKIRGVSII